MNDLILITVSAIGGGVVGFFACAVVTSGKLADYSRAIFEADQDSLETIRINGEITAAHSRCADALQTVRGKLEAIEQLANSPDTIRKKDIRAVLGGDA